MGFVTQALSPVFRALSPRLPSVNPSSYPIGGGSNGPMLGNNYMSYARAYSGNEIVYACVNLMATSAGEPHIIGRRNRRASPLVQQAKRNWAQYGIQNRAGSRQIDGLLVQNGFVEELPNHPLVKLLNAPNPFMSRGQMWGTITMDRKLAGNAYILKSRYTDGPFSGAVAELWRLRPDRVRIIPGGGGIAAYEYRLGAETVPFAPEDVIHFKELNPYDDYYGMPPLMPALERITIDNYMRSFLRHFYETGGTGPGAILTTSKSLSVDDKSEIRDRFKQQFGGPRGWFEMLVLDQGQSTYQQLGLNRGLRDALPAEIDKQNEARIAMIFGIPGSILGLLVGYESSSYANKRQDWQVLWDVTMTPLFSDYDDMLNRDLTPEFGGIDEVVHDLSQIRALQEDVDAIQDRARKNVDAGLWTMEEARLITGVSAKPNDAEHVLLPIRSTIVPTPIEDNIPMMPPHLAPPAVEPAPIDPGALAAPKQNRGGRVALENDMGARILYERGEALARENPRLTVEQIADHVGVAAATYKRYRATFR